MGQRTGGATSWKSKLTQPIPPEQRRRIERQLALFPIYAWLLFVWASYAVDMSPAGRRDRSGHIKGHDFAHFYVLGEIAAERRPAALYDFADQSFRIDRLLPGYQGRYK